MELRALVNSTNAVQIKPEEFEAWRKENGYNLSYPSLETMEDFRKRGISTVKYEYVPPKPGLTFVDMGYFKTAQNTRRNAQRSF